MREMIISIQRIDLRHSGITVVRRGINL